MDGISATNLIHKFDRGDTYYIYVGPGTNEIMQWDDILLVSKTLFFVLKMCSYRSSHER
jgi:hypothetical protein